jgi:NADH:ubiquinone oxidoreductase subunit C
MKAKEWAAKLLESGEQRDEVLKAFVEEIGTVAKQRGGSSNAIEGAVREQRLKWQAVCRECSAVEPGMFETMLDTYGPDYKKAEAAARAQSAKKSQPGQETDTNLVGRRLAGGRRPR